MVMREGDLCATHALPIEGASKTVFVNGKGIARVGDIYTCTGEATGGSSNVFVEGKAVHREGDSISCGGTAGSGSTTVFVNGK
jgi:uncharacterized Zn-binding protein involved in type VI secretion